MSYPRGLRTHYVDGIPNHKIDEFAWGPGQFRFYPLYYRGGEWHWYTDRNSSDAGTQWFVTYGGAEAFLRNNHRNNQARQAARRTRQPLQRVLRRA